MCVDVLLLRSGSGYLYIYHQTEIHPHHRVCKVSLTIYYIYITKVVRFLLGGQWSYRDLDILFSTKILL